MKKYIIIALSLVLTASMFTGCRRQNDPGETSAPTIMPTVELPTRESTETPTAGPTEESTMPTVESSMPTTETNGESNGTATGPNSGNGTQSSRSGRRIPGGY